MSEPMPNNVQDAARKLPIIPHHEVSETFADQVGAMMFDGSLLKMDLVAVRLGAAMPPAPMIGERHVVARLVLSPSGTVDLINQVKRLADQLNSKRANKGGPEPSLPPVNQTRVSQTTGVGRWSPLYGMQREPAQCLTGGQLSHVSSGCARGAACGLSSTWP